MKDFLFVELQEGDLSKLIDCAAAGEFVDMWGREFSITRNDLLDYVAKTNAALDSTRDSEGVVVGFPIDSAGHNHGDAAGWIKSVVMAADGRDVVQMQAEWNEMGRELIAGNVMRYFSPSIDTSHKVIVGGSLTNWPATRTKDHRILLKPVELSANMQTIEGGGLIEAISDVIRDGFASLKGSTPAEEIAPAEQIIPEEVNDMEVSETLDLVQLSQDPKYAAQFQAMKEEAVQAALAAERRSTHIADFASQIKVAGLPVDEGAVKKFMASLSPDQSAEFEAMLNGLVEAGHAVDFSEKGHARHMENLKELPAAVVASLETGEFSMADLSRPELALGDLGQYDLSKWQGKE
jgi:hypothetical protein